MNYELLITNDKKYNKLKIMPNQFKKMVEFIFEIGTLRRMERSHLQNLGKTEDSISDHSFRVAIIGYILAKLENLNADKVLKMCLFHDLPEARTGDQNWIHKKYIKANEVKAINDQLKGTPMDKEIISLLKEYRERKTKEAKIAKEADILEELFQLKEYFNQGNKEALRWMPHHIKQVKSESGKKIIKELKKAGVHDWWWRKW